MRFIRRAPVRKSRQRSHLVVVGAPTCAGLYLRSGIVAKLLEDTRLITGAGGEFFLAKNLGSISEVSRILRVMNNLGFIRLTSRISRATAARVLRNFSNTGGCRAA